MTTREIGRVLDQWLEGDDRVPERVVARALENIEDIPQRRASRVPRRFDDMPTYLRLLGLAAALVVAGGATYLIAGALQRDAPAAPKNILDGAATWSASRPAAFGRPAGIYEFDAYHGDVAVKPAGSDKKIHLGHVLSDNGSVATLDKSTDCSTQATYRYQTSADFLTYTVTAISDACQDRRVLLEGDWYRLYGDTGLTVRQSYTADMGPVEVTLTVPEWPGAEPGPYGATEGVPGQAPRVLRVGTDGEPGTTDYELRLTVDPRLAKDVCDVQRGYIPNAWTLAEFSDPARGGSAAAFGSATETTVSGYPAAYLDYTTTPSCVNGYFTDAECCPDDMRWFTSGRTWGVIVGEHRILLTFFRIHQPLTSEQMAIGQKLVDSLKITPHTS